MYSPYHLKFIHALRRFHGAICYLRRPKRVSIKKTIKLASRRDPNEPHFYTTASPSRLRQRYTFVYE